MKSASGKLFSIAPVNGGGITGGFCTATFSRFDPNKVAAFLSPEADASKTRFSTVFRGYS
jgi:hypothetical protein